ncbi:MAG TPA: inositol monophosphatase, partial [Candidatus Nanoarchaeia archaeon]|nr:inositol monophosphatase [Candidatus Nanoarchaeia archaeon]
VVTQAVREAGDFALGRMGNFGEVRKKSPKDFLTEVDEEAERIIIARIRERFSDAGFYGEETGRRGSGRYLFVIDPIDATTNYIKGIPLFDISVAVYDGDQNVLDVIACPRLNELYVAERGAGAYLNGNRIHVSDVGDLGQAVIGYNRSNHPPEIIEPSKRVLARILDRAATFRVFGTGGLDYCYMAKGSFDACITPLAEPFHSAGYVIMEEAGAKVTDYQGKPHSVESKIIVSANPVLHPQVLELVSLGRN